MHICLLILVVVLLVVLVSQISDEKYESPELDPKWELCSPCFSQCERSQWMGELSPKMGETNKDMCARLCSDYCQGFAYKW